MSTITAPDDRPSIAELKLDLECHAEGCWTDARGRLLSAFPALLEVVEAAMAWSEAPVATIAHGDAYRRFAEALSKVRR